MTEQFSAYRKAKNLVIFGTDRTGSTLLVSLLNAHPVICCEGEILFRRRWRRPLWPLLCFLQRIPYPFLIYRSYYLRRQSQKVVYGFKLFPVHLARPALTIQKLHQCGWLILHLQRRSLFQQSLSAAIAAVTGRWHGGTEEITPPPALSINPEIFSNSLLRIYQQRQICRQSLQSVPHLDICYEDNLEDPQEWAATLNDICDHLGIWTAPARARVHKPWTQPYHEFVSNYDDLLSLFQHSNLAD